MRAVKRIVILAACGFAFAPPSIAQTASTPPASAPDSVKQAASATPEAEAPPKAPDTQQPRPGNGGAAQANPQAKTKPGKKSPLDQKSAAASATSRHTANKTASASEPNAESGPRKIVIRKGGANEPAAQIVGGMTPEEAKRLREEAEQKLGSAGENLERIAGRPLNAEQQEAVSQIQNYTRGARSALAEGDINRGHTLAVKAYLLAKDLVEH